MSKPGDADDKRIDEFIESITIPEISCKSCPFQGELTADGYCFASHYNLARLNATYCPDMEELLEAKFLFELQHSRTVEADRLWQEEHNMPNMKPDLGRLIDWLLVKAGLKE